MFANPELAAEDGTSAFQPNKYCDEHHGRKHDQQQRSANDNIEQPLREPRQKRHVWTKRVDVHIHPPGPRLSALFILPVDIIEARNRQPCSADWPVKSIETRHCRQGFEGNRHETGGQCGHLASLATAFALGPRDDV